MFEEDIVYKMCGRYALEISADELADHFGARGDLPPRYNIAPGQEVAVVKAGRVEMARWGWSVFGLKPQINARAETIAEKPSFRGDVSAGRCLVPASAFYEWRHAGRDKGQPYAVCPKEDDFFAFAGLFRSCQGAAECVIITTAANDMLTEIHPREPVMLAKADWHDWQTLPPQKALSLLRTSPEESVIHYPISRAVNHIAHDGAELLRPSEIAPPPQMSLL